MVEDGLLGKKTGRGYYDYSNNSSTPIPNKDATLGKKIFIRILVMLINEAADALNYSIASREDIDIAMTTGVNYPKGLLKWADEIGIEVVYNELKRLQSNFEDDRYVPSTLLNKMAKENSIFFT